MSAWFVAASAVAVAGALGVVAARTPVHGVLALLVNFVGLAVLFLSLSAEFLAVSQIIIYAGAVLVLFLFVISLLTVRTHPVEGPSDRLAYQGLMAGAAAAALVLVMVSALGHDGLASLPAAPAGSQPGGFGSVAEFGRVLLVQFPFELEVVGLLLLAAMVGVMVVVGRRPAPQPGEREAGAAATAGNGRSEPATAGVSRENEPLEAMASKGGLRGGGTR